MTRRPARTSSAHILVGGRSGGDKDAVLVEPTVGYEDVKVDVELQRRSKTLNKSDGAAGRVLEAASSQPSTLPREQYPQARSQRCGGEMRSTAEREAHDDRKREDPLPIRHARQDVVDEVRRGVLSAPRGARRTDAPSLARERNEQLVTARATPNPGEAVGEHATGQEAVELSADRKNRASLALGAGKVSTRASDF